MLGRSGEEYKDRGKRYAFCFICGGYIGGGLTGVLSRYPKCKKEERKVM